MLTMKDVIREGDPILRRVAKEFTLPLSDEDKQVAFEMLTFLKNSQDQELSEKYNLRPGIGLAAPQIAISKRLIAVHVEHKGKLYSYTIFNPKIISHSVEITYLPNGEGCLSIDREVEGIVPRYARITVEGIDQNETVVKLRLRGLPAIVFQHEIDHLDGILFCDRINQKDPFKQPENAMPLE